MNINTLCHYYSTIIVLQYTIIVYLKFCRKYIQKKNFNFLKFNKIIFGLLFSFSGHCATVTIQPQMHKIK
jgi:hypothetical protein